MPVRQGTPEWLAARQEGIGSSDAPVIAGESPYRSALALWAEKSGRVPREEPDADTARLFRIGHLMEPLLLQLYTEETGRKTRREPRLLRHRQRPWMVASLDARVVGTRRIVECKWTHARRWSSAEEPVPGDVQVQVQHAMDVAGADVADVVALVGPTLRIVEIPRDPAFIAALVSLETAFWAHVESGTPPEPDGSESARKTIARLHPVDDGTYLPATFDLIELVDLYRSAKATKSAAEDAEKGIGNALRAVLRDASGIEGLLTFRKSADSTRTNWPAVASAYRGLLTFTQTVEELDAMQSIHSETVQGPRVLRLSKGDRSDRS